MGHLFRADAEDRGRLLSSIVSSRLRGRESCVDRVDGDPHTV